MEKISRNIILVVLSISFVSCHEAMVKLNERKLSDKEMEDGTPPGMKKMSFKTPDLTEEESHSRFIPESLKCDACRVVAFQLHKRFKAFNEKNKQFKGKLPESELLDLVEAGCHHERFSTYGVKEVRGEKRLSGEGLETADEPGVISGGGKWPGRLEELCRSFIEELAEDGIYAMYESASAWSLENGLCRGAGHLGVCNPSKGKKVKDSRGRGHNEL